MELRAIGVVHTPFADVPGTPIQPTSAGDTEGSVEVFPAFAEGLADLAGFERIWPIYWFDRAGVTRLRVIPSRDTQERGLFTTHAPCRPNPIGLSCVRLMSIADNILRVAGVDILDNTPLLDIKPYVPELDAHADSRIGWISSSGTLRTHADDRFHQP